MLHRNGELPPRGGEPPCLQPGPLAAYGREGGHELVGLPALGPKSLHRRAQAPQLHRDAVTRQLLQHIQQADAPLGGGPLHGLLKLGWLEGLGQAVDVAQGPHQQQHLLQQRRALGIAHHGPQL